MLLTFLIVLLSKVVILVFYFNEYINLSVKFMNLNNLYTSEFSFILFSEAIYYYSSLNLIFPSFSKSISFSTFN